ncbi:unnamed protein product [Callosobruchus maculatus]|uniref:TOG domain-containing protein n=1 Tax=Callosobruchus maculatus TaxID=64391 RepID=A0A653BSQ0_CALMS|nr:unnamed protein product [Callosobruchus maculatus]
MSPRETSCKNMQSSARSEKKNIFSDFVYQTNHKIRSAFTSGSSLALTTSEPIKHGKIGSSDSCTQTPKAEGRAKTIINKDAEIQTNFKSSTTINLSSPRKYFMFREQNAQIFREQNTQTSGTVITIKQASKMYDMYDRISPDSLSPRSSCSPKKRTIPDTKKLSPSESGLSLTELDQMPFNRKHTISNCLSRTVQPNDFKSGNLLTKTYLEKKNSSRHHITQAKSFDSTQCAKLRQKRSLKSQSYVEPHSYTQRDSHPNRFRVKNVLMSEPPVDYKHPVRYYCHLPSKLSPVRKAGDDFELVTPVQDARSYSFMSPTLSSVKKDQSLELQCIKNLISPIRKGRVSPRVGLKLSPKNSKRGSKTGSPKISPTDSPNNSPRDRPRSLRPISSPKTNANDKQVPYIDKNDATILRVTGNKPIPKNCIELQVTSSTEEMSNTLDTSISRTSECALSQAISRLRSKDWNLALRGLAEVVEICRLVEPEIVLPHMTTINQKMVELIKSQRSHVCRTACQAVGHLFEYVKDTRRPVSRSSTR